MSLGAKKVLQLLLLDADCFIGVFLVDESLVSRTITPLSLGRSENLTGFGDRPKGSIAMNPPFANQPNGCLVSLPSGSTR